jgi:hypothetical protein
LGSNHFELILINYCCFQLCIYQLRFQAHTTLYALTIASQCIVTTSIPHKINKWTLYLFHKIFTFFHNWKEDFTWAKDNTPLIMATTKIMRKYAFAKNNELNISHASHHHRFHSFILHKFKTHISTYQTQIYRII